MIQLNLSHCIVFELVYRGITRIVDASHPLPYSVIT